MRKKMLLALSVLLALTVFLFAGCGDGGSYDDTALKKQLEQQLEQMKQLEQQLKDQKDNYDTTVKSLQDKITAAEKQLTTVGGDNTKLKNEIAALKKELETLQNTNQTEPYKVGDTFTYKLDGTDLFSIKVEIINNRILITFKNIQIHCSKVSEYCCMTNNMYFYTDFSKVVTNIGETKQYDEGPVSELIHTLYFGFPIPAFESCVPYAIFKLV